MRVTCTVDTVRFGTVEIDANVSVGRAAPLPTSEATYADPGDPGEVEILSARLWLEDREEDVLAALTDDEIGRAEVAALEEARSEPCALSEDDEGGDA